MLRFGGNASLPACRLQIFCGANRHGRTTDHGIGTHNLQTTTSLRLQPSEAYLQGQSRYHPSHWFNWSLYSIAQLQYYAVCCAIDYFGRLLNANSLPIAFSILLPSDKSQN